MEYCDELYHWGIKGMKWGVRRYQKKDGSLTRAGKKLVNEGASSTFVKYKGKLVKYNDPINKHRVSAIERISKDQAKELDIKNQYKKYVQKHPEFDTSQPHAIDYWMTNLRDSSGDTRISQKYIDRFINDYADATLNDLHIKNTPAAKKYTENIIREYETWKGLV